MAKNKDKKGAMAKDPSLPNTSKRGNWKYKGKWVNPEGMLVDNYGKVIPGQKQPFVAPKENPFKKETKPTGPTKPGPKPPPSAQDITEKAFQQGGQAYTNITNRFNQFDPNTVQSEYNPEYNAQMDRVRNSYMDQFNRRNEQAFADERVDIQQQIAERGLDPSSPAAQAMVRDMNDRQDRARQEAMGVAEQLTDQRQQQFYNQATGLAQMPFEMFPAISGPLQAGMQNQYTGQQGQQQFRYSQQLADQTFQNQMKLQRDQRRGRGGPSTNPAEEAAANDQINRYNR
ncbi:hypothetical protein EBZ38_09950 [bacterium]|nr:hypothetical protein [bacterium]NDD84575.1 hypothetical protein [bacterium]